MSAMPSNSDQGGESQRNVAMCHYRTHRTQCPLPSVSLTAPVHRGLLQLELLHQEIGTIVEIIERGAGPIRGLARRRVAIAPCRDPFAGAEHIAGTNGFLRIGGVNRARLVEAPGPGRTGRAFQRAFGLSELLERELGIHGAYAIAGPPDGWANRNRNCSPPLDPAQFRSNRRAARGGGVRGRSAPDPCATQGRILQFGGARGRTPRKAGRLAALLAIVIARKTGPADTSQGGIFWRSDTLPNGCVYRELVFYPVICARDTFSSGRSWEAIAQFLASHILVRSLKSVLRQTGTGNARRPRPLPLGYASTVRRQSVPIRPCGCPECRGRSHASADAQ